MERSSVRYSPHKQDNEFWECAECRSKPGSPTLCVSCRHNRGVIERLWGEIQKLQGKGGEGMREYSGRFVLRLPTSLHRQCALQAEDEGVSLNQFLVYVISRYMGDGDQPENLCGGIICEPKRCCLRKVYEACWVEAGGHVSVDVLKAASQVRACAVEGQKRGLR